MADKDSELRVVRQNSDGRRRYDEKGKRALVEAALRPGVSVARLAQEHGINANLLCKWISKYRKHEISTVCDRSVTSAMMSGEGHE
ncbi:transposase [Burkholderia cepacia]|uniref:transposase n=1 Tax=Burkholderia cepacia TaxID=292 RepID=UPI000A75F974